MRKVTLTLAIALLFAGAAVLTPTRKPRAGPITSPVLRRTSRRSNRRRAADGDRIAGLALFASAVGFDAGVVPAGK